MILELCIKHGEIISKRPIEVGQVDELSGRILKNNVDGTPPPCTVSSIEVRAVSDDQLLVREIAHTKGCISEKLYTGPEIDRAGIGNKRFSFLGGKKTVYTWTQTGE